MTKREKILAAIVLVTFLLVGGLYFVGRITAAFDQRSLEQIDWTGKLATQNREKLHGKKADKNLRDWRARSLPEDRALAQALYLDWLGKRADAVGLNGRKVTPAESQFVGQSYYIHGFRLSGQGDLKQLTQLLYDFYSVDHMHRITRLDIKPLTTSKQLDLKMTVEALSIVGSPSREVLDEPPAHRLARPDVKDYVDAIIARNFFAPANQPPTVAASTSQQGHPNTPLTFRLQASDPESDPLKYFLEGAAPQGLEVRENGEVQWTPSELGAFEFSYRVEDGGLPSKSARGTVKLAVVEAPVAAPPAVAKSGFDPATQATVSG
ncbi:MAG: Ig-like domain-containing protein, partial [Planctomycetota bacterium]